MSENNTLENFEEDPYEIDVGDLAYRERQLRSILYDLDEVIRQNDPGGAELSDALLLMDDLCETVKSFIAKRKEAFKKVGEPQSNTVETFRLHYGDLDDDSGFNKVEAQYDADGSLIKAEYFADALKKFKVSVTRLTPIEADEQNPTNHFNT